MGFATQVSITVIIQIVLMYWKHLGGKTHISKYAEMTCTQPLPSLSSGAEKIIQLLWRDLPGSEYVSATYRPLTPSRVI